MYIVEEENTDESVIEAEQNESASKDEQPMEQSDDVGDSSASKGEAPDSSKFDLCKYNIL